MFLLNRSIPIHPYLHMITPPPCDLTHPPRLCLPGAKALNSLFHSSPQITCPSSRPKTLAVN